MRTTTLTMEQRIAHRKEYQKKWHDARKDDPAFREKRREASRKWYAEMKADKVKAERYRMRKRTYYTRSADDGQSTGEPNQRDA